MTTTALPRDRRPAPRRQAQRAVRLHAHVPPLVHDALVAASERFGVTQSLLVRRGLEELLADLDRIPDEAPPAGAVAWYAGSEYDGDEARWVEADEAEAIATVNPAGLVMLPPALEARGRRSA